jgi:hypothetical protein
MTLKLHHYLKPWFVSGKWMEEMELRPEFKK